LFDDLLNGGIYIMSFENFPYSNFHDMNLDWIINQWLEMKKSFATYEQAFKDLKEFVNGYFNNLDVQEEINKKLDTMASDGTLLNIIKPSIISETSDWLNKHIINPSNPPIDSSLTVSGAAANAKIVGDKFNTALLSFNEYDGTTPLSELKPGWYPIINSTPKTNLPNVSSFGLLFVYPNTRSISNNYFVYLDAGTKTNFIKIDENNWTTLSNYINTETMFNSGLAYNGVAKLSTLNNGWYPVINITGNNLPVTSGFGLLLVYKNVFSSTNNFYMFYHISAKTNYIKVDENNWITLSNYISNKFLGKTIITYGDSITHANNWQPYLNKELRCSTENYGIDGSKISGNNATSMCNIERINTLPDLSFIIIMGGMNDWAQNVSIDGDENDVTNFTGGCHAMFKNIINKYPSACVYCVGTSFGYIGSFSEKTKNNIGLTTLDYSKKLCEIASAYGIPSISAYENMGVSDINKTLFLRNDGDIYVHPNDEGAKKLANVIIGLLSKYKYI
jgi:hypothetical protein